MTITDADTNCLENLKQIVTFAPEDPRCLNFTLSEAVTYLKPHVIIKNKSGAIFPLCYEKKVYNRVNPADSGEYSIEQKIRKSI